MLLRVVNPDYMMFICPLLVMIRLGLAVGSGSPLVFYCFPSFNKQPMEDTSRPCKYTAHQNFTPDLASNDSCPIFYYDFPIPEFLPYSSVGILLLGRSLLFSLMGINSWIPTFQWFVILYCPLLFGGSNHDRFRQWEPIQADSCVILTCPYHF